MSVLHVRWKSLIGNGLRILYQCRKKVVWRIGVLTIFILLFFVYSLRAYNFAGSKESPSLQQISSFFFIRRDPFYNLHQFKYLLSTKACDNSAPQILIAVHSKPDNFQKRRNIRKTFGSVGSVGNVAFSTVFILGSVSDQKLQDQINHEFQNYGDIVEGNFIDSYVNMTHKHVMLMHWVVHHCPNVSVVAKIDDDVFVNPYSLVKYVTATNVGRRFHCMLLNNEVPFRNPAEKYYIPVEQFPFDVFPQYCPGMGYITTPEVYKELLPVSRDVRYINMDDVYVIGILAMKAQIPRTDIRNLIYHCSGRFYSKKALSDLIFVLNEDQKCEYDSHFMWKKVRESLKVSI